jgi:putative spermidine/putrescine transport system ATP-binding protein
LLRVRLREELHRIQRQIKITAIFVTHDQEEALSLADRIAVMSKGRVEQLDQPSAIYAQPQTLFVADFIGVMNLLEAQQEGDQVRMGNYSLSAPPWPGKPTVAIRPEDLALTSLENPAAWRGTLEQLIDLGHYRKGIVGLPGVGTLKVYLSKTLSFREGDPIGLLPVRYLVFRDGRDPHEFKPQSEGVMTLSA